MEEDSTSNVQMLAARGTFIAGTADGTVTQARDSAKRQRAAVNVSEDLLNREIQDYGFVSPDRAKMLWCFFKKYGSKKLKGQDDISSWRSKPSSRSAWRTRQDVCIAQ
jgi:hypothetical protein